MPTRAVLFDLGNTLVSYYRPDEFPVILRRCLGSCLTELNGADTEPDAEFFEHALGLNRDLPDHAVWPLAERLSRLFPASANDSRVLERLSEAFLRPIFATARLDPEAIPLLQALRALGMRLAVVSNTPWGSGSAAWRAELGRHGLLALIDAAVFCVEAGYRKPHPAPILRALAAVEVGPAEALFVGDDLRWDVAGARAAGVSPLLLLPAGHTEPPSSDVPVVNRLPDVLRYLMTTRP